MRRIHQTIGSDSPGRIHCGLISPSQHHSEGMTCEMREYLVKIVNTVLLAAIHLGITRSLSRLRVSSYGMYIGESTADNSKT